MGLKASRPEKKSSCKCIEIAEKQFTRFSFCGFFCAQKHRVYGLTCHGPAGPSTEELLNNWEEELVFLCSQVTFLDSACRSGPLPEHLMLCSPPKCKERKMTCGCKNLGCFTGIAAGCTTHEPQPLVPRLGRLDMDLYFPLHSQLNQTGKKSSCLAWVPGLYQHPILLGKVFPGTVPRAEQRGGSSGGGGNIPPRG